MLEYALCFHADELDNVALLRESQDYRCPFLIAPAGVQFEPPVGVDGEVVFSCLKGAEDSGALVMRVFNPTSEATTARVLGPVTVERVRLDESRGSSGRERNRRGRSGRDRDVTAANDPG